MAARYQAPCQRATRLAPSPHILITDEMFRNAIERHSQRIMSQRRRIMTHRGPLEGRRRLGKRTLTGAMHPHTHPVPAWHIEVLSNATLQWYAPTTPEERQLRAHQLSIPNLWGKFLKWLEMSDADEPFILPPRDIDEYPDFSTTTRNLRLSISSLNASDASTALELCQSFCATVQEGILIGQITTEDMLVALDPFDSASRQVISDMRIGGKIFSTIRSSIAEALEATQISRPDAVPDEMWGAMFKFVTAIHGRFHDVSCFNKLLTAMPESARASVSDDTLFIYIKTFIQSQATRDHRNPAWPWCCSKVGTALGQLSQGQRHTLFARINKFVRDPRSDTDTKMKTSFAWLLIQAYDAGLSAKSYTEIYKKSSGQNMDHSGYRIWQLAVARMYSHGVLPKDLHRHVAGWNFHDSLPQRWTIVAKTLLETQHPEAAIASLCDFLADLGETWHLAEGLIASHAETPCAELLQTVANTCGKLDIAIALNIAANKTTPGHDLLCVGPSGTMEQHFDKFMAYPKAESFAWRAIKAEGGTVESKMDLIDFLSDKYQSSPALSRSQKLRRARRTAAYQMALVGTVSPTVLRNAIAAVTLDLEEGHWGRETHLQWATKLVNDKVSPQAAREMQKWVEGWRHLINDATSQMNTVKVSATELQSNLAEPSSASGSRLRSPLKNSCERDHKATTRLNRFK